jgi:hypothetical protein|tara:strand:+ start:814 stop:1068 length:255 start_codon:yes stop_codon:yes gene_type:complete
VVAQRLPSPPEQYNQQWASLLIDQLERIHELLSRPAQTGWTTTNVTDTRAIDADHVSGVVDGEAATDALCTLIEDLKGVGRLGK